MRIRCRCQVCLEDGLVKVNGNVEYQRGKKLRDGDEVTFQGETIRITL